MTDDGAEDVERRPRIVQIWREYRARWTLPLVIIVIIGAVAIVDHLDSHQIRQVDATAKPSLVAASGGSVNVELDQPWDGFNPNTPAGAASSTPTLLSSVLPSAYVIDSSGVPEVNPNLLTSVEVTSTSPFTIQYVINPAAVWSDGVPVTADDFVYAWQSQNGTGTDIDGQPDQVASTLGYRDVSSVTSSDNGKTVTVVFSSPYTDWRLMFNDLVPAHIARQVGWNSGFESFHPSVDLSAGPLVLQSVSSSGTAVLVRNPKWWGTPSVLNRVTVTAAPNQSAWTNALARDSRTVTQPVAFDLGALETVSSLPNVQSFVRPSLNLMQLEFNVTSPVFMRLAARQAIAHAIDRTALLDRTFGSLDPGILVNDDHLATASQSTYQQSSAASDYDAPDLSATDRLLRSIGYQRNTSGLYVDADGRPLTVQMAVETGDPWIESVANLITQQLHSAGITVETFAVKGETGMAEAAAANSYDMALVTRVSSPYQSTAAAWYSDGSGPADSYGSQDWSRFADPQVDSLFTQAAQDLNPVAGSSVYAQIDDQLWDQMVGLPLFEEPGLQVNGVQVANVEYNPSQNGILWNVQFWSALKPRSAGH